VNASGLGLNQSLPGAVVTELENFKTDDAPWETIEESESFVKTGDPVRQVFEASPS
jgi:hypothetical protein